MNNHTSLLQQANLNRSVNTLNKTNLQHTHQTAVVWLSLEWGCCQDWTVTIFSVELNQVTYHSDSL